MLHLFLLSFPLPRCKVAMVGLEMIPPVVVILLTAIAGTVGWVFISWKIAHFEWKMKFSAVKVILTVKARLCCRAVSLTEVCVVALQTSVCNDLLSMPSAWTDFELFWSASSHWIKTDKPKCHKSVTAASQPCGFAHLFCLCERKWNYLLIKGASVRQDEHCLSPLESWETVKFILPTTLYFTHCTINIH